MLLERYDDLLNRRDAVSDDDTLLGDKIDSRKAYFRRLSMRGGRKPKRYRGGSYRQGRLFSNKPISQRVLVKAHFKRHGVDSAGNLRGHLSYITRDGAGVDGDRPALFGSAGDDLGCGDFYHLCKSDRHHFRFIISPENGHEIADMERYIRGVMGQVEKDLETKVEWVSAVHYDTDNTHAHVVVRGKDQLGRDLVIAPDYISNGIRMRAEELATEILGERSIQDIQRSMEKETDAMRVTSLDRFIELRATDEEKEAGEIVVDTRADNYSGRGEFYDGLLKKRLEFLTTTAMAVQEPPGVFTVRYGYTSELKEVSERHDIIKQLHRIMPGEEESVFVYDASREDAEDVQGRIEKIAFVNELTDHKYMVVRDGQNQAYYVALAQNDRSDALLEGQIVEVSSGKSTGGADENIAFMASKNEGIYTRETHLEYVRAEMKFIEDPESYVDYHAVRLQTLEKAGIVEQNGSGYIIPDDVQAQGRALNKELKKSGWKKKVYARVKEISSKPLESQIEARARTFLDLEIYRHQKGYSLSYEKADKGTKDAIHRRMNWLAENGYAYHRQEDGQFVMKGDTLSKLYREELDASGQKLASVLSKRYTPREFEEKQMVRYVGFADMQAGRHLILSAVEDFTLVKMPRDMVKVRVNEPVEVEKTKSGLRIETNRRDLTKEDAIALVQEKSGLNYKEMDVQGKVSATYLGAVNLEKDLYAAVKHENELCFVKLKNYPLFKDNSEVVIRAGQGGFAEIKEAKRQQELNLESAKENEQSNDKDVEIDW